jgi:anthrone oxygenase-like protein
LILVVLALVPALAHALELPGKLRLPKDAYLAVQSIYYPGFTVAGIAEPASIISAAMLLMLMPHRGAGFWLTLVALLGLIAMHAVYWVVTHPVNKFWLGRESLRGPGSGFFAYASGAGHGDASSMNWTELRDRWEYSHLVRAGLAALSFILLLLAMI